MTQMRIFLSHSSQDKAFADALVKALRGAGADVWYDEHNLGTGQLLDVITRELQARPVFLVLLSKAAFASVWVRDECRWAYNLSKREPQRILLPVVAAPIDHTDFNALLYVEDFKRIEAPGGHPYPPAEAIERTVRELALVPAGNAPEGAARPGTDVESLVTHGKGLVAQQRYEQAIPFFQVAAALAPDTFDAWYNLGRTHNLLERWQQALPIWDRALTLRPEHAAAWNNKGVALSGLQRDAEALTAYDRALALDATLVGAWVNMSMALNSLERSEEALAASDRALALDPHDAAAWSAKGNALRNLQQHADALVAYDRALALDPRDPDAWNGKGNALYALNRPEEALTAYDHALAVDPNSTIAWLNKAVTLFNQRRYAEALPLYDNILALKPGFALAWRYKSQALHQLGRKAEAREADRRANELGG